MPFVLIYWFDILPELYPTLRLDDMTHFFIQPIFVLLGFMSFLVLALDRIFYTAANVRWSMNILGAVGGF